MAAAVLQFLLLAALLVAGITVLSGHVFPLVLHHLLKPVGLEHWVDCGQAYVHEITVYIAVGGEPRSQLRSWWGAFWADAYFQLEALPLFAVFAILPAVGIALWISIAQPPAPFWLAAILGAIPGLAMVAFLAIVNFELPGAPQPTTMDDAALAALAALGDSRSWLLAMIWTWLISRSVLVAVAAVFCTAWINRWISVPTLGA